MFLSRSVRRLFQVSLFAIAMNFASVSSAQAFTFTLNWAGTNGISLTGTVTGNDDNFDGVIKAGDFNGLPNEVTFFTVTFRDSTDGELATYTLANQQNNNPSFNLNYQLSPADLLQAGNSTETNGFSIGSSSGYILETTSGVIGFTDNNFVYFDTGTAALTATPVPFEFEGSAGILTLGAIWGVNKWRKNRLKK
jgi:hypothetical protein